MRSKLHLPAALTLEVIRSAFTETKMVNKTYDGNKEGGDYNEFIYSFICIYTRQRNKLVALVFPQLNLISGNAK